MPERQSLWIVLDRCYLLIESAFGQPDYGPIELQRMVP